MKLLKHLENKPGLKTQNKKGKKNRKINKQKKLKIITDINDHSFPQSQLVYYFIISSINNFCKNLVILQIFLMIQ